MFNMIIKVRDVVYTHHSMLIFYVLERSWTLWVSCSLTEGRRDPRGQQPSQ